MRQKHTPTRTDFIELHKLIRLIERNSGYTPEHANHTISTYSYAIYRRVLSFDSVLKWLLERINKTG